MSTRNKAHEILKAEFAETFGVSEAQLERLFQQGMPHAKKGRLIKIPMPAGRVWYHNYLVEKGKKQAAPTTLDEARRRKETAQAELEELKLAREQGKTMLVEEHEKLLADAYARVRAKLLNLPPRGAGAVLGALTLQDCQAKLEPLVTEIMEELHAADDVPDPEQTEAA